MNYVGIKELKAKLSSYVDKVCNGEQVVITEHGEEVGIIIPISKEWRLIIGPFPGQAAQVREKI